MNSSSYTDYLPVKVNALILICLRVLSHMFFFSLTCSTTHSHSLFIAAFVTFQFKCHFLQEASPGHTAYNSLLGGSASKESVCNAGDLDSILRLGRFPGGGHGNPLWYSCLENLHGQRSLAGYSPWGCKELDTTEWLGEGNGTPLQYSCLENPMDGGAW